MDGISATRCGLGRWMDACCMRILHAHIACACCMCLHCMHCMHVRVCPVPKGLPIQGAGAVGALGGLFGVVVGPRVEEHAAGLVERAAALELART